MTPERIEELMQGCYAAGGPDSETIRAALRQCAREAADEALERAAEACKGVAQGAIYGLAMGKGTWPKADYVRDELWHRWQGEEMQYRWSVAAIRALKGKP